MADTQKRTEIEEHNPLNPNPIFSLFSKFLQPPKRDSTKTETTVSETKPITPIDDVLDEYKPDVVSFPDSRLTIPPLQLEAEELVQDTNPVVLWQVYALGGLFILRWVWARWNERRAAKKKPSDEDPSPADD